jgi:sulfate transport system permease protein
MTSLAHDAATVAPPRPAFRPRLGGAALGRGLVTAYLSIIVLLPIAALVSRSFQDGFSTFWQQVTTPEAVATLKLTFVCSLIVVAVNIVTGTALAWVLVRDSFRGQKLVNSVIDLPFALPTIVAGLVLLTLYGNDSPLGIHLAYTQASVVLALLFVTLPFVVRSVQPVLMELDRESEEAAASLGAGPITTFRRVILPSLTPAILAGSALAFARAIGEFGSLVLITGTIPFHTEAASVFIFKQIESDNTTGAAAVSVVLLLVSIGVLLLINLLSRWSLRHGRPTQTTRRRLRLGRR